MSQKPVIKICHYIEDDDSFWVAWLSCPNVAQGSRTLVANASGDSPSEAMNELCKKWPYIMPRKRQG